MSGNTVANPYMNHVHVGGRQNGKQVRYDLLAAALENLGQDLFEWQADALEGMRQQAAPLRACLYHRTGAGKTTTALLGVAQAGYEIAVVIAPPSTHAAWTERAKQIGLAVLCMSHAKFRMKDTHMSRTVPVIADEFHLFGGHGGKGWKKLDQLARGLKAPLILASATPNYNDAERVYCIQHILHPDKTRGGYLEFLYDKCITEQNPFSQTPIVTGFKSYPDAEHYLASMQGVYYVPDELVWSIDDTNLITFPDPAFEEFGYDARSHRVMASGMEERHKRIANALIDEQGMLSSRPWKWVKQRIVETDGKVLIYCNHSTVAEAVSKRIAWSDLWAHVLVTGKTSTKVKETQLQYFKQGHYQVLVGTASLATGTDGLDKVCDMLIILDDTDDDALRRQLVGRIMPRGADSDASNKRVLRLLLS